VPSGVRSEHGIAITKTEFVDDRWCQYRDQSERIHLRPPGGQTVVPTRPCRQARGVGRRLILLITPSERQLVFRVETVINANIELISNDVGSIPQERRRVVVSMQSARKPNACCIQTVTYREIVRQRHFVDQPSHETAWIEAGPARIAVEHTERRQRT